MGISCRAGARWLVGAANVEITVGMAVNLLLAAEMKIRALRVADWPAAILRHQRGHRFALCERNDGFWLLDRERRLANCEHDRLSTSVPSRIARHGARSREQ